MSRSVPETIIPVTDFAAAMRDGDAVFSERVSAFEAEFGSISIPTLSVLAQTAYICWFEDEFETDLIEACKAIASGGPTSVYICSQITPARWITLNEYVIAVQRWLGKDTDIPGSTDVERVTMYESWLGKIDADKRTLGELFLSNMVDMLLHGVSLSRIGSDSTVPKRVYDDFRDWYSPLPTVDGTINGAASEELTDGMKLPDEPACQYRWSRYLDIKVASIGALEWRANLPADSAPKEPKKKLWGDIASAFRAWDERRDAESDVGALIHDALGARSDLKAAIVNQFLNSPPPGTGFCDWTIKESKKRGATFAQKK